MNKLQEAFVQGFNKEAQRKIPSHRFRLLRREMEDQETKIPPILKNMAAAGIGGGTIGGLMGGRSAALRSGFLSSGATGIMNTLL